jgi:hypothetical protein
MAKLEQTIVAALEHHVPESVITRVANHVTLQLDQDGCYLSFYEAVPPLLVGGPDEIKAKVAEIKTVRAHCVARVFLPAGRLRDFLSTFTNLVDSSSHLNPATTPAPPESESIGPKQ